MIHLIRWGVTLVFVACSSVAFAAPTWVRWTGSEDKKAEFVHILDVLRSKTHFDLHAKDFLPVENRELATSRFQMYVQAAGGIPIEGMSIRIWSDRLTDEAIQVEASLEKPAAGPSYLAGLLNMTTETRIATLQEQLSSLETMNLVRSSIENRSDDAHIYSVQWKDIWSNGALVRAVRAKGRRGTHVIKISISQHVVLEATYEEYPQVGLGSGSNEEFSIPAKVYPIYEEVKSTKAITQRIPVDLKYIRSRVARLTADPYSSLRTRKYPSDKLNPILGETEEGRSQGYWSMNSVKRAAEKIRSQLPLSENSGKSGGIILEGRYATISLHPEVVKKFPGVQFAPQISPQIMFNWQPNSATGIEEMLPLGCLLGKPILTLQDALSRPARRLAQHDPATYINDGFDEIQVYYAINTLFESLTSKGFTDPELSTRPFNAFLYNPDVSMRDNAFYTEDTINFTTYSPSAANYARDNSTIWHELGHGVMDRLMGNEIRLADTGGLSEGMADFVADLVIKDVTQNQPFPGSSDFRILNNTGFNLTNEVHDDGEAYGGAMHDLLVSAMQSKGQSGLDQVADLVLESMRLTRNHPGLSAEEWFNHMLFADALGNGQIRAKGEFHDLVVSALQGRNFDLTGKPTAAMILEREGTEIHHRGPGTREHPIQASLGPNDTSAHSMRVRVKNGGVYQFRFPVTVRVTFDEGPLQGAIHWKGKENGPMTFTLNSLQDSANFELTATGTCDHANREDGSCVDYAYIQLWNDGDTEKPRAKKRFYVQVRPRK